MARAKSWMLQSVLVMRRDGFTFTEIIVVLGIISILAGIAIPNWNTLLPNYALKSAARQVQSEVHRIKSRAVAENTNFRLVFADTTSTSYTIQRYSGSSYQATGENKPLPEGISLASTSDTILGLNSRGMSLDSGSEKTVRLCNIKKSGKNVVLSELGRIRIDDASC